MTQYRFVTDYKFNRNTGMFNFKTTATINFNIKFIKSCLFEGTVKSEGYKTSEEDMKFSVYENMKNACEKQSKKFVEMFTQISSDYIRKSLHKYKGEVDMEAIEENVENIEEKIEEKKEGDEVGEGKEKEKDKENVNKKDNTNINKNNKNMIIVLICVMGYFIIQMMLNEQVSVANKAVSLILVGVVGYMMWNNYKENK
jgi:cation transport ATPase